MLFQHFLNSGSKTLGKWILFGAPTGVRSHFALRLMLFEQKWTPAIPQHQNHQYSQWKWRKMARSELQHCEIIHIRKVFKRFLNSAQHTFWVAPKGFELLSFTKCNKNQWKALKTFNYWPSKWRTYQYSSGFTMFLKLARSMISSPSNPSKITNFYRSQNAIKKPMKWYQFLVIWILKLTKILIFHCFYKLFWIPLNTSFGSLPRRPGKSICCGLLQSLKHFKNNGFGRNLLSRGASREQSYWFSSGF